MASASLSYGPDLHYPGSELALFERAVNWKSYFRRRLAPYIVGSVLEVGAGLGGTTRLLCDGRQKRWAALEPDPALRQQFLERAERNPLPGPVEILAGTTGDLVGEAFDAVLYIDVLEHIEDDSGELTRAAALLAPGGALVVLSPAHPFLYTPFDRAIGHHRRYTARSLAAVAPAELRREALYYLDSVGLLASLANKLLLRQRMPTARQIGVWDRMMVPLSRFVDPLFGRRLGKSVVGVWRKR